MAKLFVIEECTSTGNKWDPSCFVALKRHFADIIAKGCLEFLIVRPFADMLVCHRTIM